MMKGRCWRRGHSRLKKSLVSFLWTKLISTSSIVRNMGMCSKLPSIISLETWPIVPWTAVFMVTILWMKCVCAVVKREIFWLQCLSNRSAILSKTKIPFRLFVDGEWKRQKKVLWKSVWNFPKSWKIFVCVLRICK